MRYAVTGATGFIGAVLARRLCDAGHDVVALARAPARARELSALGVTLVRGDLDNPRALTKLCDGADGLFHVAGWYRIGSRRPAEGWRINVEGTRHALAAADRARVPRVVFTSTLAVNSDTRGRVADESYRFAGEHLTVYDETKARAHEIVSRAAANGTPAVTVMPGVVYGPGDTSRTGALLTDVIAGGRPLVPDGGRLCWSHVEDIAQGHLLAMEHGVPGESYMLAGEQASLAETLRLAAELAGAPGPITLPAAGVRVSQQVARRIERRFHLPEGYESEAMRASIATYLGSSAKAERELGWSSRSLRDGLRELVLVETSRLSDSPTQ